MKTRTLLFMALLFVVAGFINASGQDEGYRDSQFHGPGYGMGMHGYSRGNPWSSRQSVPGGERIGPDAVEEALHSAISRFGNEDWEVNEIMEFESNFYAEIRDGSRLLMEVLVDPYTGYVQPEFGPNMMWNTEYGHRMGFWQRNRSDREMRIGESEAVTIANRWLAEQGSSWTVEDHADRFPGYYTLHTMEDGQITGMLSVNGWSGEVWYHNWHGTFLGMISDHEEESDHS